MKKKYSLMWFLPFLFFVLGYYCFAFFLKKNAVIVPNLVGNNLQSAVKSLTEKNLNISIIKEIFEDKLPEGIILSQDPSAGNKLKKNKKIFVNFSKKNKSLLAPNFFDKNLKEIDKFSKNIGMNKNSFWLNSFYPIGRCFAQNYLPEESLDDGVFITYISQGESNFFVIPNFKGCKVFTLLEYLDKEKIILEIFYKNLKVEQNECLDFFVVEQKPVPGSIINLDKKLYFQIRVLQ